MSAARLLVVEDNDQLRTSLAEGLRAQGFLVDAVGDGLAGWERASAAEHDLLILDRMLPGLDGLEILRRLRRAGSSVPVLVLTARDAVEDRVAGLDAGADDYLVKPFAVEELLARLRTLLRRGRHHADPVVAILDLEIDTVARSVRRGQRRIDLTPKEYALLEILVSRAGAVVPRLELQQRLYPGTGAAGSNVVDVLVGRLRRKLHPPGAQPLIHTRRGFGYSCGADE
jgi:two-component system copper resistance phosphate regulon response regulator CusR